MSIMHKEMFGINETLAKEILEVALSTGGDFAEVYMEKQQMKFLDYILVNCLPQTYQR